MNIKKGFVNLIFVVVVVTIVGVVGYFGFVKRSEPVIRQIPTPISAKSSSEQKSEPITRQPTSINPQTTAPTTTPKNETANWEVYRNEKYGIEFKHPAGWYISDGSNGGSGIVVYERRAGSGLSVVNRFMQIIGHENETTDVKTYAYNNTPNFPMATNTTGGLLNKEQGYVIVSQTQSYQTYIKTIYQSGPMESPMYMESLFVRTYVPHKSAIFEVIASMDGEKNTVGQMKKINPKEETNYLGTYKLILSTFRFLD
ncbi:MAG: hypothetical protein Q7S57_04155 [bacterium]|nr:hypothetical protein [bacterium]